MEAVYTSCVSTQGNVLFRGSHTRVLQENAQLALIISLAATNYLYSGCRVYGRQESLSITGAQQAVPALLTVHLFSHEWWSPQYVRMWA